MLVLATLLALTVADLEPLPADQQVHLNPTGFAKSVQSCVDSMDASELYCGCVVRGFQMFLPRKEWERVEGSGNLTTPSLEIIYQVQTACRAAASD